MLLGIGKKTPATDLRSALLECHDRIRSFSELACRLASTTGAQAPHIVEAASSVRRYFTVALPLHVADEEESIAPLLRGRDAAVDRALEQMAADHAQHEALLTELCELCERVAGAPAELEATRPRLDAVASALSAAFAEHLALEESVILPAIERVLTVEEQASVRAAMKARRAK